MTINMTMRRRKDTGDTGEIGRDPDRAVRRHRAHHSRAHRLAAAGVSLTAALALGGGLVSSWTVLGSTASAAPAAPALAPIPAGSQQIASTVDSNGNLQVAVIGADGTVSHDITGQTSFDQVLDGGQPITATRLAMTAIPATATTGAGDVQLVTVGTDGNIYHTIRNADGTWQANLGELPSFPAGPVTDVGISAESDGTTLVAAIDNDVPYLDARLPSGTWSGWQAIPAPVAESRIAIATSPSNVTQIVISGQDLDNSTGTYAVTGTPGNWGAWQQINTTIAYELSETWTPPTATTTGFSLAEQDYSPGGNVYTTDQQADGTWSSPLLMATGGTDVSLNQNSLITLGATPVPPPSSSPAPTTSTPPASSICQTDPHTIDCSQNDGKSCPGIAVWEDNHTGLFYGCQPVQGNLCVDSFYVDGDSYTIFEAVPCE